MTEILLVSKLMHRDCKYMTAQISASIGKCLLWSVEVLTVFTKQINSISNAFDFSSGGRRVIMLFPFSCWKWRHCKREVPELLVPWLYWLYHEITPYSGIRLRLLIMMLILQPSPSTGQRSVPIIFIVSINCIKQYPVRVCVVAANCLWNFSRAGTCVSSFILCSAPLSISKHRTLNYCRVYNRDQLGSLAETVYVTCLTV
jgi:hypothetical protein